MILTPSFRQRFGARTAIALSTITLAACGVLAHGVSNDGDDVTNPQGTNPGQQNLSLVADSTSIAVGDATAINLFLGSTPFPYNTSEISVASSDSTKVVCCALALSVGSAKLTYTYGNTQASVNIGVYKNPDTGASAVMSGVTNPNTGISRWLPDSVQVSGGATGAIVEFYPYEVHNVVFDSVPGAPANIPVRPTSFQPVFRTFAAPGTYPFRCTVHGETGVIVVTP